MRRDSDWARAAFASVPVARLASADERGQPHLVPIVFAVIGDTVYFAIDHKPKSGKPLRRLINLAQNPTVSLLADHYADDWAQLWWARADGRGRQLGSADDEAFTALTALTDRYPQYREAPPNGPVIAIDVFRWSGWTYAAASNTRTG